MRKPVLLFALGAAILAAGCGPNCQLVCSKAFKESECNLSVPGQTQDELFRDCVVECTDALGEPGELDGFDPDTRHTSGESIEVKNEKQAALWMDCVDQTACELLEQGYCAGGGI
jgi:hypothetical protein